ncbi:MAG: hypothetical protein ACKESB_01760 [Candidatus Hodgkinia cicadicola]
MLFVELESFPRVNVDSSWIGHDAVSYQYGWNRPRKTAGFKASVSVSSIMGYRHWVLLCALWPSY